MLSSLELQMLAEKIKENIRKEFKEIHLSGSLMDTIRVEKILSGFNVEIPAEIYDLNKYRSEGVVIYTGQGSYAQAVDVGGGFSGMHKNYVLNAIMDAIEDWKKEINGKVGKVSVL